MKTQKKKTFNNCTKKYKPTQQKLNMYCKKHANTFNSFEEEYGKKFKVHLSQHEKKLENKLKKNAEEKI